MKSALAIVVLVSGCAVAGEDELSTTAHESFEDFRASTYRETFAGGLYIVDGDTPVLNDKQLYEMWESQETGALIVNTVGGNDDRWSDTQKKHLTYCVSNNFGSRKATVIAALEAATTAGWEARADVDFIHVTGEDGNCTTSNTNVVFDVRQVSNQPYLARAFFPSSPRAAREVLIDVSSFGNTGWPLSHILGHELGHVLGFRHEHSRPEAATCFEDNNWRPLTPYDSSSIMHYPQCNGASQDLDWTATDASGAAALYGAPGGGTTTPPTGSEQTETRTGSVAASTNQTVGAFNVKVGTPFVVAMTGSGDPDLYVRWNSAPTTTKYNCRPYIDGATETCTMTVPAGATTAHVMVRGYTAATFSLDVRWTTP